MKKALLILTAMLLLVGAMGCKKTPAPKPQDEQTEETQPESGDDRELVHVIIHS